MRVRVPPPPPDNAPRATEDTQPFDLSRVKPPSMSPAAEKQSVAPHLPPRRANVVVGALPSVMVDDAPNASLPRLSSLLRARIR
jgi:hypothetical protein